MGGAAGFEAFETDEPAVAKGRLLGEIVRGRAEVMGLLAGGQYAEAGEVGDRLLGMIGGHLDRGMDEQAAFGYLPHAAQRAGLLADLGVAAVGAGDPERAQRLFGALRDQTGAVAAMSGRLPFGMLYCKDGRPSLDGSCLQLPPCSR
jgi:hypothetical protein